MIDSRFRHGLALLTLLAAPAAAQHRLALQGQDAEKQDKLVILGADGSVETEIPWGSIQDMHVLPNGNLMVQRGSAEIVELAWHSKRVVWSYNSALTGSDTVEVHSFQPLPNGNVAIAESGPARFIEVDRHGRIQRGFQMEVKNPDPYSDTRTMRLLDNGNILVCHPGDGAVREYETENGTVVWEYAIPMFGREKAPGIGPDGFGNECNTALRMPSGNTLITTGNGHSVLEVTPERRWSGPSLRTSLRAFGCPG